MSTHTVELDASPDVAQIHLQRPAFGIVAALFCGYLAVGLPLPVLPLFVRDKLGFSNLIVGLVVGIQFLATILTRGYAGRVIDSQGGKRCALQGAGVCALAGLLYFVAAMPSLSPPTSLAVVILGRLIAGFGEGQFVTGCVSWSIASVGPKRAGVSMSWTGIAMFGALAIGAPVGMGLYRSYGLETAMVSCIATPIIAAIIAIGATSYTTPAGERLPFYRVVGQIWREGVSLMLQGVGLSGLTAFASLYFAAHAWTHAGLVMTAFGTGFILVRVALGTLPDRIGGYRVALWSLVTEAVGQTMVWGAPNEITALAGALVTGLGCALVFPALGVEALERVLPANRGSAMGAFVAFLDIAYGFAGPAAGLIAGNFGYAAVYLLGAASALLGAALIVSAITERKRAEEERERLRQVQDDLAHLSRVATMGELTASLTHEIRQPIAAAATDARTCLRWLGCDQPDVAEAREAAARTVKDVTRAADIIGRISALFKKSAPQRELVDANEVIREMFVLLRSEANRCSISIRTQLAPDLPKVMADPVQLQQVFMNLMLNGIDAMKGTTDGGELTIKSEAGDAQLLISVSDTGVGFPPEQADQIFTAFVTTKDKGTGMGLPISRSIIESHGGRLWAASVSGRGATFHFTLPVTHAAHA